MGTGRDLQQGVQHGWRAACSAKSRRVQRCRTGVTRRMGSSYPVHRALFSVRLHSRHRVGVHPCPAVAGDHSGRRGCGWWPDLAQQRQPRLGRVWCLASCAGGSVVRTRPDAEQAVGLVRLPTDRFAGRRHAPADARGDQLLRRAGCRHCVLCRARAGPTGGSRDQRRRACGSRDWESGCGKSREGDRHVKGFQELSDARRLDHHRRRPGGRPRLRRLDPGLCRQHHHPASQRSRRRRGRGGSRLDHQRAADRPGRIHRGDHLFHYFHGRHLLRARGALPGLHAAAGDDRVRRAGTHQDLPGIQASDLPVAATRCKYCATQLTAVAG
jgi:hypothetical protein